MRIVAILTPKAHATQADFQKYSLAEEQRVWELYAQHVIREMYFQPDPVRVALVMEADSPDAVRAIAAGFPMVKAGLFDVDTMQLGPWLPFAVLFGPQAQAGTA